jgi:hypothetical protein
MGLVMEDRSRLEHLMGIAQSLRLKGSKPEPLGIASTDQQRFDKPPHMRVQSDAKAINGVSFGGGILSALNFSKDSASQDTSLLAEAGSSIPRCGAQLL